MNNLSPMLLVSSDTFGIGLFYFMIGLSVFAVTVWGVMQLIQYFHRRNEESADEDEDESPPEDEEDKGKE